VKEKNIIRLILNYYTIEKKNGQLKKINYLRISSSHELLKTPSFLVHHNYLVCFDLHNKW